MVHRDSHQRAGRVALAGLIPQMQDFPGRIFTLLQGLAQIAEFQGRTGHNKRFYRLLIGLQGQGTLLETVRR